MELKEIKELIKIIKDENLEDLKINVNGEKLHLINSTENVQINVEQISKTSIESEPVELLAQAEIIKSSNVGKIKLLYLEKGMHIKKGAKLAQITTMGVVTDIKAPVSGKLADILVSDQANVDYAKPLFVIEITDSE
jgi:biotin carboxyl carrier protein